MDYCAALNFLRSKRDVQHVYKTLFYPIKIDSYFQKHKIFEILGELMIRLAIDRPSDTIDYSITKLLEIARKFKRNIVTIEFDNCTEEASRMLKELSCQSHIPIIECAKEGANWRSLLTSSSLGNHHFIICDFKSTISHQKRMKIAQTSSSTSLNECRASSEAIDVKLCEENLKQVLHDVRLMKPTKMLPGEWNRRIFVVGRIGSGRRTQAALIAQQFGLIFIDFDYMMTEWKQQCSETLSNDDLSFWGFAQRTILKPNCLRNGYICASSVISKEKLEILMEKFIYSPNQIIFLHTNEEKCRRRISRRKRICASYQAALDHKSLEDFVDHQMNVYEVHKREFVEYFRGDKRKLIFHVNSNGKIDDIKNCTFSHINKFC